MTQPGFVIRICPRVIVHNSSFILPTASTPPDPPAKLPAVKYALVILALLIAGCGSNELDTGYRPRPLTDSSAQRRAYYVNPYSSEADPNNPANRIDPSAYRPRGF